MMKLPGKHLSCTMRPISLTIQDGAGLDTQGIYHYRRNGEQHAWNPETIGLLQWATRTKDYQKFKEFSALVNQENRKPLFLRGCVNLKKGKPVPIEEVEPEEAIMKRFVTGAMSYGSISKEAHEALGHCHEYHRGKKQYRRRRGRCRKI